ncbi:unnamed protein product, partial [Ectocarpus sp. 4 AP-2014]
MGGRDDLGGTLIAVYLRKGTVETKISAVGGSTTHVRERSPFTNSYIKHTTSKLPYWGGGGVTYPRVRKVFHVDPWNNGCGCQGGKDGLKPDRSSVRVCVVHAYIQRKMDTRKHTQQNHNAVHTYTSGGKQIKY